jgi:hypothetical protein
MLAQVCGGVDWYFNGLLRNISTEPAYLMGMASGRDPGMINWPDQVKAAALAAGISLP